MGKNYLTRLHFRKARRHTISDITILYITANRMPDRWIRFALAHLENAANGAPVISLSRLPMSFGMNIIDTEPISYGNIYMQMLKGAQMANTAYVAVAEDDTLYTKEHFHDFRPPVDAVSYDRSRWSLFTWDAHPLYCIRQRISNCSLIAPREYLIDALTERKNAFPRGVPHNLVGEVGRETVERRMGVSVRQSVEWYCRNPIVQLNHPSGTDTGDYGIQNGRHMVKKHGQIKAYDIPYWGKASDIVGFYDNR